MKSKVTMFLLSLAIAFGLWFYVISVVSPDSEITFNNINVDVQGDVDLKTQRNLVVTTDMTNVDVDLVLEGNRTDLINLSRSDISVTADISWIDKPGKHEVPLDVYVPGTSVTVKTKNPDRITVVVENRVTNREVPLTLTYDKADLPQDYTLKESGLVRPEFITVSGPESLMSTVGYAEVVLDLKNRQESFSDEEVAYILYDTDGNVLENALLEHDGVINLTLPILYTKELPLDLILKDGGGATAADAQVKFYVPGAEGSTEPDEEITTITVSGSKAVLEQETELNLANVDLAAVRDGQRLTFVLEELPLLKDDAINNESGLTEIYAEITFPGLNEREFTDMLIQPEDVPDGLQANLSKKRTNVVVRGPAALVNKLTREDFSVIIEMTGAEEGKEYYTVKVVFDPGFETLGALTIEDILVEVVKAAAVEDS